MREYIEMLKVMQQATKDLPEEFSKLIGELMPINDFSEIAGRIEKRMLADAQEAVELMDDIQEEKIISAVNSSGAFPDDRKLDHLYELCEELSPSEDWSEAVSHQLEMNGVLAEAVASYLLQFWGCAPSVDGYVPDTSNGATNMAKLQAIGGFR